MKTMRNGFACVIIVMLMSVVTLITVVISTTTQQLATLAHNRTLHLQQYYMTRALFGLAHEHPINQESIIQLPFSDSALNYSGKIIRNQNAHQQDIITAQLYCQTTVVCSLSQLE